MSVTLVKGQNISLDKAGLPGPTPKFIVALGWDPATVPGVEFDLDAQVILVDANNKVIQMPVLDKDAKPASSDSDSFFFYNQRGDQGGAVLLSADDRTGGKVGDDETAEIDTSKIPATIEKAVFTASIHEAGKRGQNFGQVKNGFIRIVDGNTQTELLRFDLSEDASADTAMIFGELYRKDGSWKFKAIGTGTPGGLENVGRTYGVNFA